MTKSVGRTARVSALTLACGGAINVVAWILLDRPDVVLFTSYFDEVNTILWLAIRGRLFVGLALVVVGVLILFVLHPAGAGIGAASLFVAGLWNGGSDLLAIPALQQYGRHLGVDDVLSDLSVLWLLIAMINFTAAFVLWSRRRAAVPLRGMGTTDLTAGR